jgi:hypothetical protein
MNWNKIKEALNTSLKQQGNTFKIKDTVEYPLAFNIEMPPNYHFDNGNISFRFVDFVCSVIQDVDLVDSECFESGNQVNIGLQLHQLTIKGKYIISAMQAPKIGMDVGGNMRDFDEDDSPLMEAGADEGNTEKFSPEEQKAFLENARAQRTRLMDTPNGRALMEQYDEHDEIYNEVFIRSEAMRRSWQRNGAVAEMAKDTHVALIENGVINPPESVKKYGKKSYNTNAFLQQVALVRSTYELGKKKDPQGLLRADSKYAKAAMAALDFEKHVKNSGNAETKVKPFTKELTFQHINGANGLISETTVDELENLMSQSNGEGGAEEAAAKNWVVLTSLQRQAMREWNLINLAQEAREQTQTRCELWMGDCIAVIKNTSLNIQLLIDEHGQVTILKTDVNLPAFEFDIDDAAWTGEAGNIVRERLAQLYFVKSLVAQQVEQGIQDIFNRSVTNILN